MKQIYQLMMGLQALARAKIEQCICYPASKWLVFYNDLFCLALLMYVARQYEDRDVMFQTHSASDRKGL
jgi:hypothetical protein